MSDLSYLPAGYHSVTAYLLTEDVANCWILFSRPSMPPSESHRSRVEKVMEPMDQFYGDRGGGVLVSFGNEWCFGTRNEEISSEGLAKRRREARGR